MLGHVGRFGSKYVGMIFCDGILLGMCWPAFGVCFDESAAAVHTLGTGFLPTLKSGSASSSVTDVPWKEPDVLCCCPEGLGEPELILFTLRYVFHQVCLHDDFWKSTDVPWKEPDRPLLLPRRTWRTLTDPHPPSPAGLRTALSTSTPRTSPSLTSCLHSASKP